MSQCALYSCQSHPLLLSTVTHALLMQATWMLHRNIYTNGSPFCTSLPSLLRFPASYQAQLQSMPATALAPWSSSLSDAFDFLTFAATVNHNAYRPFGFRLSRSTWAFVSPQASQRRLCSRSKPFRSCFRFPVSKPPCLQSSRGTSSSLLRIDSSLSSDGTDEIAPAGCVSRIALYCHSIGSRYYIRFLSR